MAAPRFRAIDVITAREAGLIAVADAQHLAFAAESKSALYSCNISAMANRAEFLSN